MKKLPRTGPVSLRRILLFFLLGILALFLAILLYNNVSVIRIMDRRIISDAQNSTLMYQKQLRAELDRIDTYLFTTGDSDADFNRLTYMEEGDAEWVPTQIGIRTKLFSASYNYTVDGLFAYVPESDTFIFGSHTTLSFADAKQILLEEIGEGPVGGWTVKEYEGEYYLVRTLKLRGVYLGAVIRMSTFLSSVTEVEENPAGLYLVDGEGKILRDGREPFQLPEESSREGYWIGRIERPDADLHEENTGKVRMLAVIRPVTDRIVLGQLLPMSDLQAIYRRFFVIALIAALTAAAGWFAMAVLFRRQIVVPVTRLTEALADVSGGSLERPLPEEGRISELRIMTRTYNQMIAEIRDLKIDAYERRIEHQELEMQYLKQQVAPHFMINCLNTAYQLTEFGELDLARKMLRSLSDHLRYILSSGKTVSLSEELKLVRNYIEMSSIRYPESLDFTLECDEGTDDATVVPLGILNFVENTIKHNATSGSRLGIDVSVRFTGDPEERRLKISVSDTGKGIEEGMLSRIRYIQSHPDNNDGHIGVGNTILRITDVFPDAGISFDNIPSGTLPGDGLCRGARVEIDLPYRKY